MLGRLKFANEALNQLWTVPCRAKPRSALPINIWDLCSCEISCSIEL